MSKTLIILASLLASSLAGASQTALSPTVIASNGGVNRYSEIELEWTLGESVIGTTGSSNRFYTVGFHQPLLISRQVALTENITAAGISVFPNPVGNMLKIQFQFPGNENLKFLLTDLMGNTMLEKTVNGKSSNAEISVGHLIPGIYQLRVITASGSSAGTFKIIKLN